MKEPPPYLLHSSRVCAYTKKKKKKRTKRRYKLSWQKLSQFYNSLKQSCLLTTITTSVTALDHCRRWMRTTCPSICCPPQEWAWLPYTAWSSDNPTGRKALRLLIHLIASGGPHLVFNTNRCWGFWATAPLHYLPTQCLHHQLKYPWERVFLNPLSTAFPSQVNMLPIKLSWIKAEKNMCSACVSSK